MVLTNAIKKGILCRRICNFYYSIRKMKVFKYKMDCPLLMLFVKLFLKFAILGTFEKLLKATVSFVTSAYLSLRPCASPSA
jgi:hypothetical protein